MVAWYCPAQINAEKYRLSIEKTTEKIKINGVLDELTWANGEVAKEFFINNQIYTGIATQFSEARPSYDDESL